MKLHKVDFLSSSGRVRQRTEGALQECHHRRMEKHSYAQEQPIQHALATWAASVEAVLQDIDRIARGGLSSPSLTGKLIASVEAARQQCEAAKLP